MKKSKLIGLIFIVAALSIVAPQAYAQGEPARVLDKTGALMGISPDGKWIAYAHYDPQTKPQMGVAIIPVEGGAPVKLLDLPVDRLLRWMPDGRALAYIDHRDQNVWAQPLDGMQLALARGTQTSDVVMITDFK
jgi:hypothetical protein